MKHIVLTLALLVTLFTTATSAGPGTRTPPPAQQVLQSALKEATTTHRNVLMIFHASWCIWCRRLDSVLTNPEVKNLVEKNYIVIHLDVLERGDKKETLENPGGEQILKTLGGEQSGLPFYAFLDAGGNKLADSNVMPGRSKNIGFPGSAEEINAFGTLLGKTATHLTPSQRRTILKAFEHQR
jgi:thiol:disulfide interchange protein